MRIATLSKAASLLTLLLAVTATRAHADNSLARAGIIGADESNQSHALTLQPNKFSTASLGNKAGHLGALNSIESTARVWLPPGGDESGIAVTRLELANLSVPFRANTVEETVRQFHRDGLPIARLWQSQSSALNIGFSPKGKPGLWFIKKLP